MSAPDRAHVVIGTAGHVDHGKTSLVQALTGVDCDRLPEEKARGITIELGFARWHVGEGLQASVVDVPGHERFVRTMVAGASGIDSVILVVAADDGVMPQTREHLAICALLGVRSGVVALTKCDLATDDLIELVEEDIREATQGTFLEATDIVRCSTATGAGLPELGRAAVRSWTTHGARSRGGPAFLAADRVFTKAGAGTILTGTLARGAIAIGDELEGFRPNAAEAARFRVRAIEVHGRPEQAVQAATRLALNLRVVGSGAESLERGTVIAAPGSVVPTRAIDVALTLLPDAPPLGARTALRLHLGTTSVDVHAVALDVASATARASERSFVRLTARVPFAAHAGQRFVVRRSGAHGERTVGGGVVVDPRPTASRRRARSRPFFFEAASAPDRVRLLIEEARYAGITRDDVERRSSRDDEVDACLGALLAQRAVVLGGGRYYAAPHLDEAREAALAIVHAFHVQKPLLAGISSAEVTTRSPPRLHALAPQALADLVAQGAVVVENGGLVRARARDAGAGTAAGPRQEVLASLAARLASAGLAPPLDEVLREDAGLSPSAFRDALAELKRTAAIRAVGGFHFDAAALASLRDIVGRWFTGKATLAAPEFKELCGGITRKHAIPLLEHLDREGVTVRRGDARMAGPALAATAGAPRAQR